MTKTLPVVDAFIVRGHCDNARSLKKIMRTLSGVVQSMFTERNNQQLIKTDQLECRVHTEFKKSTVNGVDGFVFAVEVRLGKINFTMTLTVSEFVLAKGLYKDVAWRAGIKGA